MTSGVAPPLLDVRDLTKRYPGVVALEGLDLTADAGEVHALVGANGAGKSTLMNLLSGVSPPSRGEIRIAGEAQRFADPAAAQACGIATVHQELSLVPQLSVARNIFLGREPRRGFGLVDRRHLRRQADEILRRFNLGLDPDAEIAALGVADQQLVEIARALSYEARILILDEPTSVLSLGELDNLFAIIRRLKSRGLLVFYVSHHLREVLEIADRVTVLRDGRKVSTRDTAGLSVEDLVEAMLGSDTSLTRQPRSSGGAGQGAPFRIAYRSEGLENHLSLRGGEIVGIAGLVGAGRTGFARAVSGSAGRGVAVKIDHDGRRLDVSSPRRAAGHGIVYITEDRKRDGLFGELDIIANATASVLSGLARGPFRDGRRERAAAGEVLERLRLVASSLELPVASLSGGNQQKVLIGRALLTKPRLLVCDEPTRGIDIGAKAEIHEILRGLAKQGVAILVVSSEIDELLALSHRIVVMHERRFVAEMAASEADEAAILVAASGGGGVEDRSEKQQSSDSGCPSV